MKMAEMTYGEAVAAFSLDTLNASFDGDPERAINACVECCDRHVGSWVPALRWVREDRTVVAYGFDDLQRRAARFANALQQLGVARGDRVAGLLPRTPDLVALILGTWRLGAVYLPLFTAFGPKAIEHRLCVSQAKLIVTDAAHRAKLEGVVAPARIAVLGEHIPPGDIGLTALLARTGNSREPEMLCGDDPFLMMFTSGTTGPAKALEIPVRALASFMVYMRVSVGLRPDDVLWNMADPGWAYGLYYAVAGPLLLGQTTILHEGAFTPENFYRTIGELGVTVLVGSPTAYRMIKAAGAEPARAANSRVRVVSSAGEPLDQEVIQWFAEHLGAKVGDHFGQTEGGMMVCNHHGVSLPVRTGSAGRAMPGFSLAVLDEHDREVPPDTPGILAVDRERSPLFWFNGYFGQTDVPRYHRTGDNVRMDADGYVYFIGRADDVITSAGYRIGPYDVEAALLEHPLVRDAAVIGKPDPQRGEIIKAFVVTLPGAATAELERELVQLVRGRLSAHAYPREIAFVDALPKTPSGKTQRFVLRAQEAAIAKQAREGAQ